MDCMGIYKIFIRELAVRGEVIFSQRWGQNTVNSGWFIGGLFHPVILTIDPKFQHNIPVHRSDISGSKNAGNFEHLSISRPSQLMPLCNSRKYVWNTPPENAGCCSTSVVPSCPEYFQELEGMRGQPDSTRLIGLHAYESPASARHGRSFQPTSKRVPALVLMFHCLGGICSNKLHPIIWVQTSRHKGSGIDLDFVQTKVGRFGCSFHGNLTVVPQMPPFGGKRALLSIIDPWTLPLIRPYFPCSGSGVALGKFRRVAPIDSHDRRIGTGGSTGTRWSLHLPCSCWGVLFQDEVGCSSADIFVSLVEPIGFFTDLQLRTQLTKYTKHVIFW